MNWKKLVPLSSSIFLGLAVLATLLVALHKPPVALADPTNLFVTPGGSGFDCSQAAPCGLPTALSQAASGDTVYLAGGTYTGSGMAVITVTESITLYGGWDGTTTFPPVRDSHMYLTTLDGAGQRRVVYIDGFIAPTLAGLTITGGDAAHAPNAEHGGGIYSHYASPVIQNNRIIRNVATSDGEGYGGGLFLFAGTNGRILDNVVLSNTASITGGLGWGGGIAIMGNDGAVISGNQVAYNVAQQGPAPRFGSEGGGIYCASTEEALISGNTVHQNIASVPASGGGGGIGISRCDRLAVIGNTLHGNIAAHGPTGFRGRGGSIWAYYANDLVLDANRIISNTATFGGGLYLQRNTTFTMTNNIIANNFGTEYGGGIAFDTDPTEPVTGTLAHNTFVANNAGDGNGRIAIFVHVPYVTLALTNNLIYSHTYGVYVETGSTATLLNTLFYENSLGDTGGPGALTNTNPITGQHPLVDTDHHLLPQSPAIDAGAVVPWVSTDIDGDSRPLHDGYDIGADEAAILPEFLTYLPVIRR